jgi:N-acetyl sugar amidotransferase
MNPLKTSHMRTCDFCIMDESASEIVFDKDGICNFCKNFKKKLTSRVQIDDDNRTIDKIIKKIKKDGISQEYDCIIGVSGGVDSTYLCYLIKKMGLRPLAVHFDNGWNSELAVINIENLLTKLNIDLITYVVNWGEFKDLQKSFLISSTPDGEVPSDHGQTSALYWAANKHNVKYIISGLNYSEEGLLPRSWSYGHIDWGYIKNIHKRFGQKSLKTYPHYTLTKLFYYTFIKKIKKVHILNYIKYNRSEAINIIKSELAWKSYGWKHHESIYTRFWQSYVLPKKFGIDKRRAHLSNLICSGKITRERALEELGQNIYGGYRLEEDMAFVVKKLGLTSEGFEEIMSSPIKSFQNYRNSNHFHKRVRDLINFLRLIKVFSK